MSPPGAAGKPGVRVWLDALWIPAASTFLAAAALGYALFATRLDADAVPAQSPERAAEEFATAYWAQAYAEAAKLATGDLRRNLEQRARSLRLQGRHAGAPRGRQQLLIDESFVLANDRLRFTGQVSEADAPEAHGWPISITLIRDGDSYLAEAVSWPKGPPPDDR